MRRDEIVTDICLNPTISFTSTLNDNIGDSEEIQGGV